MLAMVESWFKVAVATQLENGTPRPLDTSGAVVEPRWNRPVQDPLLTAGVCTYRGAGFIFT